MITKTAKIMQKQVVAEFVETPEILEELRAIGVDFVQGYAIGRPVPVLTVREQKIA
jgi:EAL domain-containing protein (putative c-di-GMP-specific phosphodiesterase class I)